MIVKEADASTWDQCPRCVGRTMRLNLLDSTMMKRHDGVVVPIYDVLFYSCDHCGQAYIDDDAPYQQRMRLGKDLEYIRSREESPLRIRAEGWNHIFTQMKQMRTCASMIAAFNYMLGGDHIHPSDRNMLIFMRDGLRSKGVSAFKSEKGRVVITAPDFQRDSRQLNEPVTISLPSPRQPAISGIPPIPDGWVFPDGINPFTTESLNRMARFAQHSIQQSTVVAVNYDETPTQSLNNLGERLKQSIATRFPGAS